MSKVPKIIHQIWIGDDPLSEDCKRSTDKMKDVHERLGYKYYLWGNEIFDRYKDDKFLINYREKKIDNRYITDRLRLLILRDFGGIYIDVDADCIRSFNSILNKLNSNISFFAGTWKHVPTSKTALIDVGILGSEKNSFMINKCLETYTTIHWANGGQMIGEKILQELDENTVIFNYRYFYDNTVTDKTVSIFRDKCLPIDKAVTHVLPDIPKLTSTKNHSKKLPYNT